MFDPVSPQRPLCQVNVQCAEAARSLSLSALCFFFSARHMPGGKNGGRPRPLSSLTSNLRRVTELERRRPFLRRRSRDCFTLGDHKPFLQSHYTLKRFGETINTAQRFHSRSTTVVVLVCLPHFSETLRSSR